MITFAVVDADGNTPSDNPRLDAYRYMARLQYQGRTTSLVVTDGRYTVNSAGLAPMTFCPIA
jgi:Mg-chelatase subunit ChlD